MSLNTRLSLLFIFLLTTGLTEARASREFRDRDGAGTSSFLTDSTGGEGFYTEKMGVPLSDSVRADELEKLRLLRVSIKEMIVDIDKRIARIDSVRNSESEQSSSFSAKLFGGIKSNFMERRLTWLQDIRNVLNNEQQRLEGITNGMSKASLAITQAKLKMASKLKKLFQ